MNNRAIGYLVYLLLLTLALSLQVLTKQLLALVEMQNNPRNFSRVAQVLQRDRFLGLQVSSHCNVLSDCVLDMVHPIRHI